MTVAKMTALLASLAIASVLSRLLSKSDYGVFCQILMIYSMLSIVFRSGIPQSVYFFLIRLEPNQQKGLCNQSILLMMFFGGFLGAGMYFGADFMASFWNSPKLSDLLRAYALYPVFMLPIMVTENIFISLNRYLVVFFFNIGTKIAAFFVVVIPIYLGYTMVTAVHAWVIFAAVQLALAFWFVNRSIKGEVFDFDMSRLKEQLSFALPLGVAAILGALGMYADRVCVNTLGNTEMFAEYFNGAFELPLIGVIGGAVTMTLLPVMSQYAKEGETNKFLELWYRSQTKLAFVLFPVWIYFFVFADDFIVLLFGEGYSNSAIVFRIYLCLVPARIGSFNRIVSPLNKNWLYTIGHMIQLVLAYPLCYFLFLQYSVVGVAIGVVLSIYGNILFMAIGCSRLLQIRFLQIWPIKYFSLYFIISMVCGVGAWVSVAAVSSETVIDRIIRLVIGMSIFVVLYLLITFKLGLFNYLEWRNSLFGNKKRPKVLSD